MRLTAGWNPVMTQGEWTYPELRHDTGVSPACRKQNKKTELTLILAPDRKRFRLRGFFSFAERNQKISRQERMTG